MKNIILLLMLFPLTLCAQTNYPLLIDSFMHKEVAINNFNGNILVSQSGNIIYQNAFGYRNFYTKELLNNNSVFELASISKQFTAEGILILKEKGKLSLTDTITKFFPQLPYGNVTISQMLTHTSGLPEYVDIMLQKWDRSKIAYNKDVIALLAAEGLPLNFNPGDKWEYCNTGYVLLASIIEKVSGLSYNDFMMDYIFKPLGMTNSRGYNTRRSKNEIIPNYAFGFVYSDSLQKYILPDSSSKYNVVRFLDGIQGDGTINATTSDLLKWDRALKNYQLVSQPTQDAMFAKQVALFGGFAHYGYGVMINNDQFGTSISHSGNWPGYSNYMVHYPSTDITIIILCNVTASPATVSSGIAQILNNIPFDFPYIHTEIPANVSVIKKLTGNYFFPSSGPVSISETEGKMVLTMYGGRNVECKAESPTKFFYIDPIQKSVATIEIDTTNTQQSIKIWHTLNYQKNEVHKQ